MSKKKSNNTVSILLSVIFGIVAAAFVVLTIMSLTGAGQITTESGYSTAPNYVLDSSVKTNALSEELGFITSNEMKRGTTPGNVLASLKAAYAINNNLAGYLRIPGTELETVITQSNNNDHYLTYNFYERSTSTESPNYGNPFLDYRCRTDGALSNNTIIHGHTTGQSDGIPKQSFRSLYDYQNKSWFIDHPIIKYSTLTEDYTFKICAVFYSTTQKSADNGYFFDYIYPDMSESDMQGYIRQVNERKLYDTGVSLEPTDNIITLSTCIYVYGSWDTRLVVVGRLLHDGEGEDIDASLVKDNPDYRRPDYWYKSKGQTNPYADSPRWEPSVD